jgi:hypothetical protein
LFDAVSGLKERFSSASFAAAVVVVSSPSEGTVMNTYVYGKECVSDVIGILTRSALFFSIALFFYCNKKQIKTRLRENAPFLEQFLDVQMKCLSPFRSSYFFLLAAPLRSSLFVVVLSEKLFL